jgi:hypothetical protein
MERGAGLESSIKEQESQRLKSRQRMRKVPLRGLEHVGGNMNARGRFLIAAMVLLAMCAVSAYAEPPGFAKDLTYTQRDGAVDILKGKTVVAGYVYKDTPRPYIYPLLTPAGIAVTRNYPMKTVEGEPTDHVHHRSMWISFGDVNGMDFWGEAEGSGKIVQTKIDFNPITVGPYWSIHTTDDWLKPDGKKMCADERYTAFYSCDFGTLIVSMIKITASAGPIKLGDTKEGFAAIRLAPSLALKGGTGHILNSEGDKDDRAWGKRAKWVDYTGQIDGKTVGVTMFDAHTNYGYPTYWHARDYGLLAANPFGGKAFTGDDKMESPLSIERGKSVGFRYITLIHDGSIDAKTLDALAAEVAGRPDKPYTPATVEEKAKSVPQEKGDQLAPSPTKPKPANPGTKRVEPKAKPAPAQPSTSQPSGR